MNNVEQDTEIHDLWMYIREWNDKFGRLPKDEDELAACIDYVIKRQKPTDKVEPKFKVGDKIVEDNEFGMVGGEITDIDNTHYELNDGGIYIPISHQDNYKLVEEQKPANPAWSEKYIADVFEKVGLAKIVREQGNDQLTNAVQSAMIELSKQQNLAYSEEDRKHIDNIISLLNQAKERFVKESGQFPSWITEILWLQSLKPQKHWKPNEKQMEALNAINVIGEISYVGQGSLLMELYNELKKL